MIDAEPADAYGVRVYQFEADLYTPVAFYLAEFHERRFQPTFVEDVRAVEGRHFWIAFRETKELERGFPPLRVLNDKGYRVGEGILTGEAGQRVYLLPVWQQTIGGFETTMRALIDTLGHDVVWEITPEPKPEPEKVVN